jgi:hypothetical protein
MSALTAHKLQVKFYVADPNGLSLHPFVAIFHDWIKRRALDELLIDVADYGHVHRGPGVLLVGHAADYYLDLGEGRPGLLFSKKREAPAVEDRLADGFRRALAACELLEKEPELAGRLRFSTGEVLFRINDRLRAPNTADTFAALRPELAAFARRLYGEADVSLVHEGSPRELFSVRVIARDAAPVATLLDRLGAPPH